MTAEILRVYYDPAEIDLNGYPYVWHKPTTYFQTVNLLGGAGTTIGYPAIKDLIRDRDGHRCLRCKHPYRTGEHGNGEWSPCNEHCVHRGPTRYRYDGLGEWVNTESLFQSGEEVRHGRDVEAQWRILTVHHLNGIKHDCRWFNLVSLCQRCHLSIQTRVVMDRAYTTEHTDWFKPFAAAFYALKYLGEELTREQVDERLDELLHLEHTQASLLDRKGL